MTASQRVNKPIDTLKTSKKEGIFCESEYVGVRVYGSVRFRKKQAMARVPLMGTRAIKIIKLKIS